MKLINTYKSNFLVSTFIFKFIYDSGYLYTTCVLGSTTSSLLGYVKVLKGYKYEDS